MGVVLFYQGYPAFEAFGLHFLWSTNWNPVTDKFGALPSIWGTVVSSFLAIVIATPISLGIAVFLTEMAPHGSRGPSVSGWKCSRPFRVSFTECGGSSPSPP